MTPVESPIPPPFARGRELKDAALTERTPEHDLHCPTCGYNLRGLDVGGVCPECGAAIARAVELRRLADEIGVWPRLRGCAGFVGGASLVAAAGFAANAPTAGVGVPCIFPFVVTFVTPMGAIAGFFFHAAAVRVVGRAKPFSAVLIPGVCVIAAAWNAALHFALPPQPGLPFAGPGLLPATVAVCLLPALLALVLVVDAKACEILRLIRGHASAEMRYALVACCWLTTLVMIGSVIYARVWAIPIGSCFRAALICWTLTLGLFGVRMLRARKAIAAIVRRNRGVASGVPDAAVETAARESDRAQPDEDR